MSKTANQQQQSTPSGKRFTDTVYTYSRSAYQNNIDHEQDYRRVTATARELTPEMEKTARQIAKTIGVHTNKVKEIITHYVRMGQQELNPHQHYHIHTIHDIEENALYYAAEKLSAESAKSIVSVELSKQAFTTAVSDKKGRAHSYLTGSYSNDLSRNNLLNSFYEKSARETNLTGEYAKNAAAQRINTMREHELANGHRNRLSHSMLHALEKISKNTGLSMYELKDLCHDIYTSKPAGYWNSIGRRKFSEESFKKDEFFKGNNRLTYQETLFQDEILGTMQQYLQNAHQDNDQHYDRKHVDFQKGYNYLAPYKDNLDSAALQKLQPALYEKMKNLGMRDDQITSAVTSAAHWCLEDY